MKLAEEFHKACDATDDAETGFSCKYHPEALKLSVCQFFSLIGDAAMQQKIVGIATKSVDELQRFIFQSI
jgi:hypothetical protein